MSDLKWISVLDSMPDDDEEVLCLIQVGLAYIGSTPPSADELQPTIASKGEHEAPFTGKYEDNSYCNWRVWYWMRVPPPPAD